MTSAVSIASSGLFKQECPSADRHPALVYLARLSPGSRPTQKRALDTLAEIASGGRCSLFSFPWSDLRYATALGLRAILAERYAPATANRHLAALRGVLREAWRLGYLSAEEFHRTADLRSVGGERQPAGRSLDRGELRALFEVCVDDRSPAGARDTALLAVLYAGGLRRAEAVGIDRGDYDTTSGALLVRHGKGRKERRVYLNGSAQSVLGGWLRRRGDEAGPLFFAVKKGGRIDRSKPISGQAVLYILRRRASQAGVKPFSPHDLRRTFIGDLLDAGADIATVQALAGHANVQTTARYDRRPEEARRQAGQLLSIPVGREIWEQATWAA